MSSGGGLKNREEQSKKLEVTVYNGRRGREGEPSTSTANCIENDDEGRHGWWEVTSSPGSLLGRMETLGQVCVLLGAKNNTILMKYMIKENCATHEKTIL